MKAGIGERACCVCAGQPKLIPCEERRAHLLELHGRRPCLVPDRELVRCLLCLPRLVAVIEQQSKNSELQWSLRRCQLLVVSRARMWLRLRLSWAFPSESVQCVYNFGLSCINAR